LEISLPVTAHCAKGYGPVVMTHGENGHPVAHEILDRVARAYGRDTLDKPALRQPRTPEERD